MTSASWTFSATRTAPLPASVIGGRALAQAHHIDAVAEHVEGAALVELGADAIQEGSLGGRTLLLHQSLPGLRLGFLDPGEKVRREQGAGAVVEGRVALGVEPAVIGEVGADLGFEGDFLVETHAFSPFDTDLICRRQSSERSRIAVMSLRSHSRSDFAG